MVEDIVIVVSCFDLLYVLLGNSYYDDIVSCLYSKWVKDDESKEEKIK